MHVELGGLGLLQVVMPLGGFESGLIVHWLGPVMSVVSVVATILVVIAVATIWPEIRRYGRLG